MKKLMVSLVIFFIPGIKQDTFSGLYKLEGLWRMTTPMGPLFEEWKKLTDNHLTGKSYTVKGKDTIVLENIVLKEEGKQVYYIPTVKNQNNAKPVAFTMVSDTDESYVFEFMAHDYPQRIIYRFVTNDSVVARIEGNVKGKEKWSEFYYTRVK